MVLNAGPARFVRASGYRDLREAEELAAAAYAAKAAE
jgi:hypothetical protein